MRPIAIIIMDGFGISPTQEGNAIANARKPNLERLWKQYPTTTLKASGLAVGLPRGQMGNSEVGHLNLGGGRIVYQDLTRISLAVENGTFASNPVLQEAMNLARKGGSKLHLIGLLSDGGVHSHITHLYALLEMARSMDLSRVFVHAILDGRDVPPRSALGYFRDLEEKFSQTGTGSTATVSGRYYTMDRDRRWERVEKAYRCLVYGEGLRADSAEEAVRKGYDRGENDEFIMPTVVDDKGMVDDGDSIIFFNFRPDRAREITRAFVDKDFQEFATKPIRVHYTCMTQYDATLNAPVAYPAENLIDTLGEVVSRAGLKQLRIAETEKYAHVTYFFNGGKEEVNPGEDRVLIPSPKVATYDLQPQMSAYEVRDELLARLDSGRYDLVVLNFANPDMVGHTGIFEAAVKAVEVVDGCVGEIVNRILSLGGAVLLTADHGNAEKMQDSDTGQPHTAHTTNPVPISLITSDRKSYRLREDGILADVAPTALELMHIPQPEAMTGRTLINLRSIL
ncbi:MULTISPECIES: 2,3-bisphosphoglycerate-independent phosphoglycerate mutase [Methanothrix]|jgi:2,3-bisphosphoglycerate-independent phosphoglycerate mutase|uniref:2,3-bisphosphoglycerate-independent phosphoglycerate mutase n=1 Tax=Methanothrix TaxID=2222 RepID=UPI00257E3508|nr:MULTISPECIES: 2,3-bisphosphoglycerate-independent phosphoglycerate mutase [Methanothrix]MDY0412300.1 2,3-bisphosphoglycerate-independent phosphoglycerate mutase [Methanothrix soehngenii]HNQ53412.1 2,3-bisphosphoglycerate-independent phosphoglycerate mutase [Methanothrix soehngenii]HNT46911.1 2,3-bisphosphoglycerate-independent phosphoglycerate mutase [Methanothrix soehngenii]HOE45656.1 2,3-bisphosphoglycerate-independent phosphoglycerate mutase [Methanothrix soehngenii]HOI20769.1 2,3-bispho